MKKILLVGNHEIVIFNFRRELIDRLLSQGYEVYISLPYGKSVDILTKMGCHFIDTPVSGRGKNPFTDLKLIKKYKKILRDISPDVVLTYTIKPNLYCGFACKQMGIPQLANITGLGSAVENPGLLQLITVWLYRMAFKKVSCVFFQNEENRFFFEKKHMFNGHQRLLPGSGVNLEHFKPLPYPNDNVINFLYVGRIIKEKGIDQYLEAAEIIKNKYPNTSFRVIGSYSSDSEYAQKLEAYEDAGTIFYAGMQTDVRPFLQSSHCIIHPSYYPEGMSNALLEAEACARPVITTDRSGCRETLVNGVNGFIIEPKNTAALVKQIEKFIKLPYEKKRQMGIESRHKVELEFDRNIVVDAYIEEIESCIGVAPEIEVMPEAVESEVV